MGYATLLHAAFKFHFGICHFPFWYIPLSILAYANYHSGICHFPFWHMPLSILAYATFHFGICNFPFWHMPLSNLGYVDHMSIKCKDIITNMKYLSQNIMKSVDLIKLIVAIDSSTVHLYFVVRQRTSPGRTVPGAASGAQQPGPSAGPSAVATPLRAVWMRAGRRAGPVRRRAAGHAVPGAASGAQQPDSVPGPSAGPSANATPWRAVCSRAGRRASVRPPDQHWHQSVPPARISPSPRPASVRPITETRIWQGGKGGGSARAWIRARKPAK